MKNYNLKIKKCHTREGGYPEYIGAGFPIKTFGNDKKRNGVYSMEYAVLIAIIILGLLAMQFYLRRALCGKYRDSADSFGNGRQYDLAETVETEVK